MSWKQNRLRPEFLYDKMDTISRVNWPTLRGNVRRNDPDGGSPDAYFTGLTGSQLRIQQFGDNNATYTINFAANSYVTALAALNAAAPAHLFASDDNGYIRITSTHGGNRNGMRILPAAVLPDAAVAFGFDVDPLPNSVSYAGEVATAPTGWPNQSNRQGSKTVARDEGLSTYTMNRPLIDILNQMNLNFAELDKELAIPVALDVTVTGGSFTAPALSRRLFTAANGTTAANPQAANIEKFITLLNTDNTQVFVGNTRARVDSVTYGNRVDQTVSFTAWGTVDGKSVFGNGVWNLTKASGSISAISGNVLTVTGANFVTNKVAPNDTLIITLATNNTPFNHNGEFYVDAVIDETHVAVRPKNPADLLSGGNEAPACLNLNINGGEAYGTATVVVGKFIPLEMKGASATFNISPNTIPNGTYRVILPLGRTLRQVITEDLTASTIPQPSGGQIELGSKLSGLAADAIKPRIITGFSSASDVTLIHEVPSAIANRFNIRIYAFNVLTTIPTYFLTANAKWNGTQWVKDLNGAAATSFGFSSGSWGISARAAADNAAWGHSDWVTTVTLAGDANVATTNDFWNGLQIGGGFSSIESMTLPRITYIIDAGESYSLIDQSLLDSGSDIVVRRYHHANGTLVTTINAAWDGLVWTKDVTTHGATKLVFGVTGVAEYHHRGVGPFGEVDWTSKDIVKDWLINDDFIYAQNELTASNTAFSDIWTTGATMTRTGVLVGNNTSTTHSVYGNLLMRGKTTNQTFTGSVKTRFIFPIYLQDFTFTTRVRVASKVALESRANTGLFIGIKSHDGDPYVLGALLGSDHANWHWRKGTAGTPVDTNSLTAWDANEWVTFTFHKYNSELEIYLNEYQIQTRQANTVNYGQTVFEIAINGALTGLPDDQEIVTVDYLKLWAGRDMS